MVYHKYFMFFVYSHTLLLQNKVAVVIVVLLPGVTLRSDYVIKLLRLYKNTKCSYKTVIKTILKGQKC